MLIIYSNLFVTILLLLGQEQVVSDCPAIEGNNEVLGRCIDECQTDTNCTLSSHKCCFNGCGYFCTEVLIPTSSGNVEIPTECKMLNTVPHHLESNILGYRLESESILIK